MSDTSKIRGWKLVITSDSTDEEIEESFDNVLREHSNRKRMDLVLKMSTKESENCFKRFKNL